jgi:hypothetical protein
MGLLIFPSLISSLEANIKCTTKGCAQESSSHLYDSDVHLIDTLGEAVICLQAV